VSSSLYPGYENFIVLATCIRLPTRRFPAITPSCAASRDHRNGITLARLSSGVGAQNRL